MAGKKKTPYEKDPTGTVRKEVSKLYKEMEKITPKNLGADAMPKKKAYSEKSEPKREEKKESKMTPSARKKLETKERKAWSKGKK